MNNIKTWAQGFFVDQLEYKNWSDKQKHDADISEKIRVRPAPTENAICVCGSPKDAKWIASRLNLAAELEEIAYNFVTGKVSGLKLMELVNNYINK